MAQSTFTELVYDKVWTSDADFPTRQTNESQVRADMQYLFDVIKTFINGNDNVPGLLQEIVDYAATWQAGTIADESIETRHFAPTAKAPEAGKLNPGRKLIIANSDGTGGSSQNVPVFDGSADTTLLLPAAIKANLTGNVTGNLTGVAAYATALANARNFNIANSDGTGATEPVAFDGTGAITLRLPSTIKADLSGNSSTATQLATGRTFQTNLGSTSSASFNGSADVTPGVTGILSVGNGGTGQSALNATVMNTLCNALSTGDSDPQDADYYICQYAGGGSSNTNYYRRPTSKLYAYIKGKLDSVYAAKSHTHSSYATLESPAFTGTPTAPTAAASTNTTQIATTAFVKTALDNLTLAGNKITNYSGTGASNAGARRIYISTSQPTGSNGDVWIKYTN